MPHTVTKEEITLHLIKGLRSIAAHLEDGLAEDIHWEHYSEQGAGIDGKVFNLHVKYKLMGVGAD